MVTGASERMGGGSARDLRRAAARFRGPPALPRLWFFTDPERTPRPWEIAATLPAGAAVVFRHFGAADRSAVGRRLQRVCARRRLKLLIGADPSLATIVRAAGVHLPERMAADAVALKTARPDWIVSVAAHGATAPIAGADALVLSPIYPSRSASAGKPLGLATAARIARAVNTPIIALGGVKAAHMRDLANAGFAGVAGIDLFVG